MKYTKFFIAIFFVVTVGVVSALFPVTRVQAQAGETFTLNVTATIGKGSGYDNFTYVRDPNAEELSQIKFDITLYKGQGNSTTWNVVLSGVGPGLYTLPTLGSVGGREYSLAVKQSPVGSSYNTNVFFGDIIYGIGSNTTYDPQNNPIITPIPNGGTQNKQLKFRYNFSSLSFAYKSFADVPTIFKAEIVDYKGTYVRGLTAAEKTQTSFEMVSFNGVAYVDPTAGQIITGAPLSPPANKLETTYMLRVEEKTPAGCTLCYRVTNITPPSGYVLRYIRSITGQGMGVGMDFGPPWLLSQEIRDKYRDFLSPEELTVPTTEYLLSFAPTFGSSLAKIEDRMVYAAGAGSGLALVKRFINTYGLWQGNDPATDLTSGYLEYHDDGRYGKNLREPTKPFPQGAKVAYFGGKAYLFIKAGPQLMVYDVSSPANPVLKRTINAKDILAVGGYPVNVTYSDFTLINSGGPLFNDVVVLDNSPYILVSISWQGKQVSGIAALKIDPTSMNMTATSDLTRIGINYGGAVSLFGYKGGGNKYYFVSDLYGSPDCSKKLCSGSSMSVYAIYSISESGDVVVEQTLRNLSGGSSLGYSFPLQGMEIAGFAAMGAKTYMFGKIKASLQGFDITSPASIQGGATFTLPSAQSTISFDGEGKRMYVETYTYNQAGPTKAYDISDPLNFKEIGSYASACDMTGLSEQSDVIKEMKKLYNIPESDAIVAKSGCLSSGVGTRSGFISMKGNKGAILVPAPYINLPGATVFSAAENQYYSAFNAQYSSYGAPSYLVFVDLSDLASPKVLGITGLRQISLRSAGSMSGGLLEDPRSSFWYSGWNLSPIVIHRNRYVYRTLKRTADVWEFKNIAATAAPAGTGGGGTGGGGTSGGGGLFQTNQTPITFNLNSLLNIFRRILNR